MLTEGLLEDGTQLGSEGLRALLESSRGLWTVLRLEEYTEGMRTVREAVEVLEIRGDQAYVKGTLANDSLVVANGVHRTTPGTRVAVAPVQ